MAAPPTKAQFWRIFGAAFVWYAASIVALNAVHFGGAAAGSVLFIAVVFALWAAKAPRGAAIGLVVVIGTATVMNAVYAFNSPWHLLLLPVDVVALVLAWRSIGVAKAYLAGRQRRAHAAADYDSKYRGQQT